MIQNDITKLNFFLFSIFFIHIPYFFRFYQSISRRYLTIMIYVSMKQRCISLDFGTKSRGFWCRVCNRRQFVRDKLSDKLRKVSNRVNTSVASAYTCFYLVSGQVADTHVFTRVFVCARRMRALTEEKEREREKGTQRNREHIFLISTVRNHPGTTNRI